MAGRPLRRCRRCRRCWKPTPTRSTLSPRHSMESCRVESHVAVTTGTSVPAQRPAAARKPKGSRVSRVPSLRSTTDVHDNCTRPGTLPDLPYAPPSSPSVRLPGP